MSFPSLCGPRALYTDPVQTTSWSRSKKKKGHGLPSEVVRRRLKSLCGPLALIRLFCWSGKASIEKPMWAKGFTYRPCSDDILKEKQKKKGHSLPSEVVRRRLKSLCGPLAFMYWLLITWCCQPKKQKLQLRVFCWSGSASIDKPMWATCLYKVGGGDL